MIMYCTATACRALQRLKNKYCTILLSVDYNSKKSNIRAFSSVDEVIQYRAECNSLVAQSFYMEPVKGVIVQLIHFNHSDLLNKTFDFEDGSTRGTAQGGMQGCAKRPRFVIK